MIGQLWKTVTRWWRPEGAALLGLADVETTRKNLARERARADRSGERFSMVTFAPREAETAHRAQARLAVILRRRLRSTDEVGWLDEERIAAVLPSTPAAGAWKVADDVCLAFPTDLHPPLCTVYSYPDEAWDDGRREAVLEEKPVESLERLFCKPLPAWKRAIDVFGAGVGLLLTAPLFLAVALVIRLSSPGPVFFKQIRAGLGGRKFLMYKFRSMTVDAEARRAALAAHNEQDGPAFKIRNDPRVTRVGRFLRASSVDELPQLWNVLRGEMSLVGPRPLPVAESDACAGWQRRRLEVTPGLTCIWQVFGRSRVAFVDWVRMDLQYVQLRSLAVDLGLIVRTVGVMLRRDAC